MDRSNRPGLVVAAPAEQDVVPPPPSPPATPRRPTRRGPPAKPQRKRWVELSEDKQDEKQSRVDVGESSQVPQLPLQQVGGLELPSDPVEGQEVVSPPGPGQRADEELGHDDGDEERPARKGAGARWAGGAARGGAAARRAGQGCRSEPMCLAHWR